jgi:hypothetical protein
MERWSAFHFGPPIRWEGENFGQNIIIITYSKGRMKLPLTPLGADEGSLPWLRSVRTVPVTADSGRTVENWKVNQDFWKRSFLKKKEKTRMGVNQ